MAAKENFEKRVSESRFFKTAKGKAEKIINNPERLNDLLREADKKAETKGKGLAGEAGDFLATAFRLLLAYATGQYRQIPWKSLMAVTAAVVYFVMPLDLIPDLILGIGFFDDAALIVWTFKSIRADMDRFAQWEDGNKQSKILKTDGCVTTQSG